MPKHTETINHQTQVFEKAKEAVTTLKNLRPTLTPSEMETLTLLLDNEAMETINQSVQEANNNNFELLEDAVNDA